MKKLATVFIFLSCLVKAQKVDSTYIKSFSQDLRMIKIAYEMRKEELAKHDSLCQRYIGQFDIIKSKLLEEENRQKRK